MTYTSLFAGIGGFDLALNRLGHECVYVNEWDKYSAQTYEKNFGHRPDTRDITAVPVSDIPDHDLLVAGFPCQPFSAAGRRRGFEDTRGTLFYNLAQILEAKRPPCLLFENVRGLLTHDMGETFKVIVRALDELGYRIQWQLLDSRSFGVPQRRERIYIVGYLRDQPRIEVFPVGSFAQEGGQSEVRQAEGLYSGTVTAKNQGGQWQVDGSTTFVEWPVLRRLTPLECERLQGFPDNWTAGVSETQRYKQLGNAVTVNVVYEIAKRAFSA